MSTSKPYNPSNESPTAALFDEMLAISNTFESNSEIAEVAHRFVTRHVSMKTSSLKFNKTQEEYEYKAFKLLESVASDFIQACQPMLNTEAQHTNRRNETISITANEVIAGIEKHLKTPPEKPVGIDKVPPPKKKSYTGLASSTKPKKTKSEAMPTEPSDKRHKDTSSLKQPMAHTSNVPQPQSIKITKDSENHYVEANARTSKTQESSPRQAHTGTNKEISTLRSLLNSKSHSLKESEDEILRKDQLVSAQQTQIQALKQALDQERKSAHQLQESLSAEQHFKIEQQTRIQALEQELDQERKGAHQLQESLSAEQHFKTEQQTRIQALEQELDQERKGAHQLQESLSAEQRTKSEQQTRIQALEQELDQERKGAHQLQESLSAEQRTKSEQQTRIQALENTLSQERERKRKLQDSFSAAQHLQGKKSSTLQANFDTHQTIIGHLAIDDPREFLSKAIELSVYEYETTGMWPKTSHPFWSAINETIVKHPDIYEENLPELIEPFKGRSGFGTRSTIGTKQALDMQRKRLYTQDIILAAADVYSTTGNVPLTNDTSPLEYKGLEDTNWKSINIYLTEGRRMLPKTEGGLHALLKQHGMDKHWDKEHFDQYDIMRSQLIYKYKQSENGKWANKRTEQPVNDGTQLDGRTWVSINTKSIRDIGMTLSQITKDYESKKEDYHMILRDYFSSDPHLMKIINELDAPSSSPDDLTL